MEENARKLFNGKTWAIDGDRTDVEDSSESPQILREFGFGRDFSLNASLRRKIFNQIFCELFSAGKEALRGIPPFDISVTYPPDSYVGVNGAIYHTLQETTGVVPDPNNQTVWSLIGNRVVPPSTVPDAITTDNIFIDASRADQFKVYWTNSSDGGKPITQARLRYSKDSTFSSGVTQIDSYTPGTAISIPGLDSDAFFVRITVRNSIGWSTESSSKAVASSPLLPPGLNGFTATAGVASGRIDLSWNAVSPSNGLTISKYRVEWKSGSQSFSSSASPVRHQETTGTSVSVTGLTNGTAYTFRVIPVSNRSTEFVGTFTASATPTTGTGVPDKPIISANGGFESFSSIASGIPDDNGSSITSYDWRYKLSSASEWTSGTSTTSPIFSLGSLDAGTYNIQMRAVNGVGNSPWSASVVAVVTSATAPSDVTAVVNSGGVGKVVASIGEDVNDGGSAITGYQWQYKLSTDSTWTSLTSSTNPTQVISGLTGGSTYNFRVSATNTIGTTTSSSVNFVVASQNNTPVPRQLWVRYSDTTEPSYSKTVMPFSYDANGDISRTQYRWIFGSSDTTGDPTESSWASQTTYTITSSDVLGWSSPGIYFPSGYNRVYVRYRLENTHGWGAWSKVFKLLVVEGEGLET